jgi:hypothetical protein
MCPTEGTGQFLETLWGGIEIMTFLETAIGQSRPEYNDDASLIVVFSLILTLTSSSASVPSLTVGDFLLVATVFLNVVKYLKKIVN